MRLTTPLRRTARPSLIPLIDVMLVLLFFFMLVSSYGGEHRSILQLAPAMARGVAASEARLQQVQLQADGQFRIGSEQLGLPAAIDALRTANTVRLTPASDTTLQTLLSGWEQLSAAGLAVTLAEAAP